MQQVKPSEAVAYWQQKLKEAWSLPRKEECERRLAEAEKRLVEENKLRLKSL